MNAMLNGLGDQMKRQTERFLTRAVRSKRDPREAYMRLMRELRVLQPRPDKSLVTRSAA